MVRVLLFGGATLGSLKRAMIAVTAVAALLLLPVAAQQPGDVIGPVLEPAVATVLPAAEEETAQDLHSERIEVRGVLDVINTEYQLIGILFGGGKVQADMQVDASLIFHAVSTTRLDDALRTASGDADVSLNETLGIPTDRVALTAEEIRLIGGGQLLAAFQEQQEEASKELIEETVVGMTVLSTRFDWQNTRPGRSFETLTPQDPEMPDVREPPLILNVSMRLQFIDRYSLAGILETSFQEPSAEAAAAKDEKERLRDRIEENQTAPFWERSAFQVLGFRQLLDFTVPPGWLVDVTLKVPAGFTIEGATDELRLAPDHQQASYVLSGDGRSSVAGNAAVATLSSRGTIALTLLGLVVLSAFIVRTLLEVGWFTLMERRSRQHGQGYEHRSLLARLLQRRARAKAIAK